MVEIFQHHWNSLQLPKNAKLLVAVSGGIDSMVLCDLLLQSNLHFSIAHANFQLRDKDSDADENFVKTFAKKHQLDFYTKKLPIQAFVATNNASTQMAARALRYEWFEELIQTHQFDFVLTAHHLNDSLETFLINLSRGTGLKGLTGIPSQTKNYLRPLLTFTQKAISSYAERHQIKWREDSSNASNDYVRNQIRHQISPILEEIHPSFMSNFGQSIAFLNQDHALLQNHIQCVQKNISKKENHILIEISALQKLSPLNTYLFHLFKDFGFRFPVEILKLIHAENNTEIRNEKFRLIKNRTHLILLHQSNKVDENEFKIYEGLPIEKPLYLKVSMARYKDESATQSLDADNIRFPLRLRKPKQTDLFSPLGMSGKKKLSKFFRDAKISKIEREQLWILTTEEDEILYVLGYRIDDRFKINEHTNNFLNIYLC